MKRIHTLFSIPPLLVLAASAASAAVINGNFCSVANIVDYPAGQVSGNAAWTDLTSTTGGYTANDTTYGSLNLGAFPKNDLKFTDGTDVDATVGISWTSLSHDTNDNRKTPGYSTATGSEQLFAGYLQSSTSVTLTLSNFDNAFSGVYWVFLYLDTDSGTAATPVKYSVTSSGDFTTGGGQTYYGSDASDFIDDLVPNTFNRVTSTTFGTNTVGNYVMFEGMSGSGTFTITKQDGGAMVGLNGFEIIPEPGSLTLLGAGAVFALRRRRRTA